MALVKRTEEGQEHRRKYLEEMRNRLSSIKSLETYKGSDEWKSLRKLLDNFIQTERNKEGACVNSCCDPDEDPRKLKENIRVARERRSCFELVIDVVENREETIKLMDSTIKKAEKEYREAQAELA